MKRINIRFLTLILSVIALGTILTGCGSYGGTVKDDITSAARAGGEATASAAEVVTSAEGTASALKDAKTGDVVKFGKYEQDGNTENGTEDIEWTVVSKKDGRVMLVSKYCLECKPYNVDAEGGVPNNTSWETSTLRAWLNDEFLKTAFNEEEQKAIPTVKVQNYGNDTEDKIFLLSIAEAKSADFIMETAEKRACDVTEYAKSHGAVTSTDSNGIRTGSWWLRSPGVDSSTAAIIHFNGSILESGRAVSASDRGIRPAVWVSVGE